jgi:stage V sporulation protein D (sporulation-specific penicillin-binding protein)
VAGNSLLIKRRLLVVLLLFIFLITSIIVRVGYIQIVQGEKLQKMAFDQQNRGRVISPRRGSILDRNGKDLAVSASVETITVNPKDIKTVESVDTVAQKLAELLKMDKDKVYKIITSNTSYQVLKKKVDKEIGDQVRKWAEDEDIPGIFIDEDTKRFYPNRNLGSHIIGFTGSDNQGLEGIEATMEKYLKGVPGKILSETDARGNEMPFKTEKRIEAQDGLNVVLTIDETIQYFAQKALEKAIADYKVERGATAIVMDPRNGEILALVSKPDFDLNTPYAPPPDVDISTWKGTTSEEVKKLQETVWRDKAVADTYEPGSTFKAITTSAGLEEGVVTPETRVNDFPVKVGGWTMKCWRSRPHGEESFKEGVYNSCNPVFIKVAQSLGIERFYRYVRDFGFFDKTGIELPGEGMGIVHKKPAEVDMAAAAFGQRFTVTPIQLITAYSAIANGGKLIKPHVVKELTDSEGNVVKKFEPEIIRNVISKQTSEEVRTILEGVVSVGTGANAYVKGYRVAGKTGTSETTEKNRFIASFSAMAPADNPVICALVVLDDPKGESHMGGAIAAPVAGKLVEDILNYLEVERRYTEKDKEELVTPVYVPEVRNSTIDEARKKLKEFGLEYRIEGDAGNAGAAVKEQMPKPGASIPEKSIVILYTYKPEEEAKVKMPDILNKTVDEATETLNKAGLNIKINGMGSAVKQEFAPGAMVPKGRVVEVEFRHIDNIE